MILNKIKRNKAWVLGIDIGTSSLRTALFDTTGKRIVRTTSQKTYSLQLTGDKGGELSPQTLLRSLITCLGETFNIYRKHSALRKHPIIAVGTSCFLHSLIGVLKSNQSTPIYTWADARCSEDAKILRKEFNEAKIHQRTGCMLRSSFWPAKLKWLRRTQPKVFSRVSRWMSPADWLYLQICEETHSSFSMASGTGLFNRTTNTWDIELLRKLHITSSSLPKISDEPLFRKPSFAKNFPELALVPWFPAIGDGAASNLGSGSIHTDVATVNIGTSAALRIIKNGTNHKIPLGLFCFRIDENRSLIGGAISNAGNLRAWCIKEFRLPSNPLKLQQILKKRNHTINNLVVLPFWTTERSPTWPEELSGTIFGIRNSTTAIDLIQGITDATYHRLAQIAERVEFVSKSKLKLCVSGGVQKSPFLLQRLSDILGRSVYPCVESEASIRGAAVFVLEKLKYPLDPLPLGKEIRPRLSLTRQFTKARQAQEQLEKLLLKQ
jgi:gluconokinase